MINVTAQLFSQPCSQHAHLVISGLDSAVKIVSANEDEVHVASSGPTNEVDCATTADSKTRATHPAVCRDLEHFKNWQKTRNWLAFDEVSGSVKCVSCSKIGGQTGHALHAATTGQRTDAAFVKGHVKGKTGKILLKKIDKHRDSAAHKMCEKILDERKGEQIKTVIKNAETKFVERNKENIEVTEKVFRTVYECAKSHLPHTEHTRLIELQSINGVNCGNILYSKTACSDIIHHISSEMCIEIVKHIISSHAKFSIIVDESTSVANVQSMVVYLRTLFENEICTYFFGLLELTDATAAGLENVLLNFLHTTGLDDCILRNQFVGFCSDGASCMIGEHKGVATLLKAKFPLLQTFHCMAHRLELAVKNAIEEVNVVSHFKIFVDQLYKVYSTSPKNQRELDAAAELLSVELLKVQKIFDVRWVFSSYVAIKAVLRDYPALVAHFTKCACPKTGCRTSKEQSKYRGLLTKLKSWFFLSETCMLKDTLRCLKQLSLYLQNQDANILNASSHVDDTINKLQALKVIKIPVSVVVNSDDEISDNESDAGHSRDVVDESIGPSCRERERESSQKTRP